MILSPSLKDRYKNFNLIIIIIHWYDSNNNIPKNDLYDLNYIEKYYFDISKDNTEQWNIIKDDLNKNIIYIKDIIKKI